MDNKQIFAAVEITDHEVRLIVGEFFNTRFNIIKVERVPVSGLSGNAVTDETAVIEAVRKAAADDEDKTDKDTDRSDKSSKAEDEKEAGELYLSGEALPGDVFGTEDVGCVLPRPDFGMPVPRAVRK